MGSQLVPYHPEMRLGQGFNSFTQQICIDDAVVVDPSRVQDSLKRGGMTMKDIALAVRPSDTGRSGLKVKPSRKIRALSPPKPRSKQHTAKKQSSSLSLADPGLTRPDWIEQARAGSAGSAGSNDSPESSPSSTSSSRSSSRSATPPSSTASSFDFRGRKRDTDKTPLPFGITSPRLFTPLSPDFNQSQTGMTKMRIKHGEPIGKGDWGSQTDGSVPSQDVRYNTKFVKYLSDVTEDMNTSSARSIKKGRVDGLGGDSFIDTEKFKEADLNFYLRVRVINKLVNVRDALRFNPEWVIVYDQFTECFGDTFISGFVEGGELNALLSIKVLDQSKIGEVEGGIKAAFGKSLFTLDTLGKEEWERRGIDNITEISLSAVWSGGGRIKSSEKQWPIHSLMEMASSFPDLVVDNEYRTHAVITPYPYLKTFYKDGELQIPHMPYGYAIQRAKSLLDGYLEYKNIRIKLDEGIQEIGDGDKVFQPKEFHRNIAASLKRDLESITDDSKFMHTVDDMDLAFQAAGHQMKRIMAEIDNLVKNPGAAIETRRTTTFQNPDVFRSRLPKLLPKATKTLGPRSAVVVQSDESELLLVSEVGKQANMANGAFVPKKQVASSLSVSSAEISNEGGQGCGHIVKRVERDTEDQAPPRIFAGIRNLSAAPECFTDPSLRFRLYSTNETSKGFDCCFHDWSSRGVNSGTIDILAIPRADTNFLSGTVEGRGVREWSIKFSRPFRKAPEVVVWLTGLDLHNAKETAIDLEVRGVTGTGFRFIPKVPNADTWVSFAWMAYNPESGNVMSGFLEVSGKHHRFTESGKVNFPQGSFTQRPKIMAALHAISLSPMIKEGDSTEKGKNSVQGKTDIGTEIGKVSQDGFNWTFRSTVPNGCKAVMQWIAVV